MKSRALVLLFVVVIGLLCVLYVLWLQSEKPPASPGFDRSKNVLPDETMKVLDKGERFVLLAIDPISPSDPMSPFARDSSSPPPKEVFHYFSVLGKVEIKDLAQREVLLKALYQGIADFDSVAAACFKPRHGISATLGEETVDLLICYECLRIRTYAKNSRNVLTTGSPQEVFNHALKRAGLPLAK